MTFCLTFKENRVSCRCRKDLSLGSEGGSWLHSPLSQQGASRQLGGEKWQGGWLFEEVGAGAMTVLERGSRGVTALGFILDLPG